MGPGRRFDRIEPQIIPPPQTVLCRIASVKPSTRPSGAFVPRGTAPFSRVCSVVIGVLRRGTGGPLSGLIGRDAYLPNRPTVSAFFSALSAAPLEVHPKLRRRAYSLRRRNSASARSIPPPV